MRRLTILVLIVAAVAAPARASVPPLLGAPDPGVTLVVTPTEDQFAFDVTATAVDPDGIIRDLRVCIASDCASYQAPVRNAIQQATVETVACVSGDRREVTARLRAPAFGVFFVVADTTLGGCPVIGSDRIATAQQRVGVAPPLDPIPCNGGRTPGPSETGVTVSDVTLGAVVPISGPDPSRAQYGLIAAVNRINTAGGVCGRTLGLHIIDDGFDQQRGSQSIQDLESDSFALVGMNSWQGLQAAIESGFIDATGFPAIGTTGESDAEFTSPFVFPAGTGRAALVSEAIRDSYEQGARTFAVVWDDLAGGQVDEAMRNVIATLPGATLNAERRVSLSEPSYPAVVNDIRYQCGDSACDRVFLFLTSRGLIQWHIAASQLGLQMPATAGPSGFGERIGHTCSSVCSGMQSWTWLDGPIPPSGSAVAAYQAAIVAAFPDADTLDPLTEAAYVSVLLAAHALGRAGPNPTRASVAAILNVESFDLGFTAAPLSWSSDRHANRSVRSYVAENDGTWIAGSGWRP